MRAQVVHCGTTLFHQELPFGRVVAALLELRAVAVPFRWMDQVPNRDFDKDFEFFRRSDARGGGAPIWVGYDGCVTTGRSSRQVASKTSLGMLRRTGPGLPAVATRNASST